MYTKINESVVGERKKNNRIVTYKSEIKEQLRKNKRRDMHGDQMKEF